MASKNQTAAEHFEMPALCQIRPPATFTLTAVDVHPDSIDSDGRASLDRIGRLAVSVGGNYAYWHRPGHETVAIDLHAWVLRVIELQDSGEIDTTILQKRSDG